MSELDISVTNPEKENGYYCSRIENLNFTFSNANILVDKEQPYLVSANHRENEQFAGLMDFLAQHVYENQIKWFNTSSLTKEKCIVLLEKSFIEDKGTLKIPIDNDILADCTLRKILCSVTELHFFRSSIAVRISAAFLDKVCHLDLTTEKQETIFDDIEPDNESISLEIDHDLMRKKKELQELRETSRKILQNYYISKTRIFEKKNELSLLKTHFKR
tara:strand:- start:1952 stop:2605 length:654 start_codon:yes stop_codon:yes gene_type:complete